MIESLKKIAIKVTVEDIESLHPNLIQEALLIRIVEQAFLDLFSKGEMNGTVHTCVGQEFSAVALAGQLYKDDWVTSNHRCHGHFISKTKNWTGLIDELMGLRTGVCMGLGSSQHLFSHGFLSNGPQAALIPVGTGIALHNKKLNLNNVVISYFGEGTLGEGVMYEAMNLASLYQVPQLFVCENNFYSQSTPQSAGVSGEILLRPKAFGIKTFEANTWELAELFQIAKEAIEYTRLGQPAFLLIKTYRLNAHSKGDDDRLPDEIEFFKEHDPLNLILKSTKWKRIKEDIQDKVFEHIHRVDKKKITFDEYVRDQLTREKFDGYTKIFNKNIRMVKALNYAYRKTLDDGSFHIGEDITDPYGGAFKVTKGLSTDFPKFVDGSPISEAGLVGVALGMALMGRQSFAEIMFGDFMTHVLDQLVSNASKFHHMYANQISVPLRIRTPMGGKRGYGPTHSQSLEKLFLGIDNIGVVALTSLLDPQLVINEMQNVPCPLIIIENKIDYGKFLWGESDQLDLYRENRKFGDLILSHKISTPDITLVSYGETARHLADNLENFFVETDLVPELICLTQLHPLNTESIEKSLRKTHKLICIEDASIHFGVGSEIIACLAEKSLLPNFVIRIGAEPVPIPSVIDLELEILPTIDKIIGLVNKKLKDVGI